METRRILFPVILLNKYIPFVQMTIFWIRI